jgi:4-hydroxy-tetrahydrodipicolinate synthase
LTPASNLSLVSAIGDPERRAQEQAISYRDVRAMEFGRILTAMVTPFDSDLNVNTGRAKELARKLIDEGTDTLVVAGSTGESATLTFQEKTSLFSAVKEAAAGRARVVCGTGTSSTASTIELTRAAGDSGCDGVLVVTPYYNKPTQAGVERHVESVAGATRLPIILYNIPGRTGLLLSPETIIRLSKIENVVAVKDSTQNIDMVSQILAETDGFAVYSGDDSLTLAHLAVGCSGVVSVMSHVAGKWVDKMIDAYFSGDVEAARKIHLWLFPVMKAVFCVTNPIGIKCALRLTGFDVGGLRSPLTEATPDQQKTIGEGLKRLEKPPV